MSAFHAYPEYRDSGVEWLGEVPEGWVVKNIKFAITAIGDVDHYMPNSVEEGIPYLMTGDLKDLVSNINFSDSKKVDVKDYDRLSKKIRAEKGDVIVARYATIGTVTYVDIEKKFLISYSCVTIKPYPLALYGLYLFYYFKSHEFLQGIQNQINTNTQSNVGIQDLKDVKIPLPKLEEQQKIANFLDHETAKIDSLIEKQQQLIKLLKEKSQAVISHAVTKGLNPEAPMKDSGVEWLGEVPEGWVVSPLKVIAKFVDGDRGSNYPNSSDFIDDGVPFLSSKNISNYKFATNSLNFISMDKFKALGNGKLLDGDMIITVRGTIGSVAIFDSSESGYSTGFINAQMMIIRVNCKNLAKYLLFVFQSHGWDSELSNMSYGSTIRQLSNELLRNACVAIPRNTEITSILSYLYAFDCKVQNVSAAAHKTLRLLKERRTALISAAVTGKIDVRNWQPPKATSTPSTDA